MKSFWDNVHKRYDIEGDILYLTNSSLKTTLHYFKLHAFLSCKRSILMVGVGTGKDTKELSKSHIVDGYDISEEALNRVRSFTRKTYLAGGDNVPLNTYDLIISQFVAQHMTDSDLQSQTRLLMGAVKPQGVYALHFNCSEAPNSIEQTIEAQEGGGCFRSLKTFKDLLPEFKIVLVTRRAYKIPNIFGLYIYISKGDPGNASF